MLEKGSFIKANIKKESLQIEPIEGNRKRLRVLSFVSLKRY